MPNNNGRDRDAEERINHRARADAQRMTDDERVAKAQGTVFALLERARMRAAAVVLFTPLIEKASVSKALKDAVLGIKDVVKVADFDEDVRDLAKAQLIDLAKSNTVRECPGGGYALTSDAPHLTVSEARAYAKVIFEGWPERAKAAILNVFAQQGVNANTADETDAEED